MLTMPIQIGKVIMSSINQRPEQYNYELIKIQDDIRDFFGWKLSDDLDSAEKLLDKINNSNVNNWSIINREINLQNIIGKINSNDNKIVIIGAAVSTSEIIEILKNKNLFVLADGAGAVFSTLNTKLAEEAWARSLCVISDGDGGIGLDIAIKKEIPIILHAHGDNIPSWTKIIDHALSSTVDIKLVLTHQLPMKIDGMYNFGGFTDGDRAVCFIHSLGVPKERILLIGTRTDIVGRWSGITDNELKLSKLRWMEKVLQILRINY
jgi:uncharacterized Rossmann fold enzyme